MMISIEIKRGIVKERERERHIYDSYMVISMEIKRGIVSSE